jgi:hypothetical protein
VRSAYYPEKERVGSMKGEGSKTSEFTGIWKLQLTNATKAFLWRARSDILPSRSNVAKRGVVKEEVCMFCGSEREIVAHVLWSCPLARDVWSVSGRDFLKSSSEAVNFVDIIDYLFQQPTFDFAI